MFIVIEVYHYKFGKAKRKIISTSVFIEPKYWNKKAQKARGHKHELTYNRTIKDKTDEIDDFIISEGANFSFEKLDAYLTGTYDQTFNAFARYEISIAGYKKHHKG